MEAKAVSAAIYCRISSDPEGREAGVERQEADCRDLAGRLGVEVTRVFVENDTGASTRSRKLRPRYKEMLDEARAGRYRVILAYSNSRLTRRPAEWEALIKLYEQAGVRVHTVVSGSHDLSTADGRATARTIAAWDAAEAERTAERVQRAKADAVKSGQWRGGRRPFGYEADGVTVRPGEADALERAADGIIAGRSLAAVTREMSAAGFTTSSKKAQPLTPLALRDILLRPRNAGLLEVGEYADSVEESTGRTKRRRIGSKIAGKAAWPAIIPEDKWYAVRGILTDPSRRTQNGSDVRWLGSGLYRCGYAGCESKMRGATSSGTGRETRRVYRCAASGHVTREADQTDEYVRAVVAEYLRRPDVRATLLERSPRSEPHRADIQKLNADLQGYRTRRGQLADDYALGLLDGQQVHAATQRLDGLIAEAEARLEELTRGGELDPAMLMAADPGQWYLDATLDRQRAVLTALATVTIEPAPRGRPKGHIPGTPYFSPDYIRIEWR